MTEVTIKARLDKKLQNLATEQEKPLAGVENTVKVLDDLKVPGVILEYLGQGPKHPVRDAFDEMQFLADVDSLLHNLKATDDANEKLDEVNALAHWYCKRMRKQTEEPMLKKVKAHLSKNKLKAVPFDKGLGFCVMKDQTYQNKLGDILQSRQFERTSKKAVETWHWC